MVRPTARRPLTYINLPSQEVTRTKGPVLTLHCPITFELYEALNDQGLFVLIATRKL